jgi:sec-independent protein translocase protein TatA
MIPFYTLAIWDSPVQLLVVLAVALLVFGRRLPEMGKNIGKTIVEFKKGINAATDDVKHAAASDESHEEEAPPRKIVASSKPTRNVKMLAQQSDEP